MTNTIAFEAGEKKGSDDAKNRRLKNTTIAFNSYDLAKAGCSAEEYRDSYGKGYEAGYEKEKT